MFTLTISTENAAFEDWPQREVARILSELADRLTASSVDTFENEYNESGSVRDLNGNKVGEWKIN